MTTLPRLLLLALAVAACGPGATEPPALDGRTFLSTGVTDGGAPRSLVADTRIRLSFSDGQLGVSAGCNTMGGTYRLDGSALRFEGGAMTEMGCDPERHRQDDWLSELLAARPTVTLAGNDLVLTAGSVVVRLLDREVADPDLPLVGTIWRVDGIVAGGVASSVPQGAVATLQFMPDGRLAVATGCNAVGARYEADGQSLRITELVTTDMACADPAGAMESAVVGVLGAERLRYTIEAGGLTLDAGASGLTLIGG